MKIIRPNAITDAVLVSSNVPENDYAEFAMDTTYALNDYCMDATGQIILTLDVAPATAWIADRLITGQTSAKTARVVSQITSLTYYIRERTGAFTLGEVIGVTGTPGELADQGAAYPTVTLATDKVHKIYKSLSAGNKSNYPATDVLATVPKWVEISYTNRWKGLDSTVGSQTSQATSITYSFLPGLIDSVALMNLQASSVNIEMTDPTDGIVYNQTISLISTVAVVDWYTYFFESVNLLKTDCVKLDLPLYSQATLDLTISFTGTAKIGMIQFGLQKEIGKTKYSPSIGITDYSTKTVNSFGEYYILQRAFAKKMSLAVTIENSLLDEVSRLLALYRSTAMVWIGSEDYASMIVCGFYKDFNIVIPYPNHSDCSIEIEGLI